MPLTFLLPLSTYPDPTPRSGLLHAMDMAAALEGDVTALVHEVDIPDISNAFFADVLVGVPGMSAAAEARSHSVGQELVGEVTNLANRFQLRLAIRSAKTRSEQAPEFIANEAKTFDSSLLVPASDSDEQMAVVEAVLFGSGGPVWVFPEGDATSHLASAAIAWDGGRASARAVRDALPVLGKIGQVTILSIIDDKAIPPASTTALRDFLRQHNITATMQFLARGDLTIGDALQNAAIEHGAGLLVMGAYGHNRVSEFILGGATRSVLANRRLPILMSH